MNIQTFLDAILAFLNDYILPFLVTIAFVAFIWNATRYFIFESTSEEGHKKAKSLTLWSIIAFVVIASLAGIINLLVNDIGLFESNAILPDYMCEKQGGNCADREYRIDENNTVTVPIDETPIDIDASIYNDGMQS